MNYALISGAMGGLAQQIINLLKEHNYHIFALDIDKNLLDKYSNSTQVTPFICDITNDNNLLKVKEKIQAITDQIDLIINFAGIVILGSTIEIGAGEYRVASAIPVSKDIKIVPDLQIHQVYLFHNYENLCLL